MKRDEVVSLLVVLMALGVIGALFLRQDRLCQSVGARADVWGEWRCVRPDGVLVEVP